MKKIEIYIFLTIILLLFLAGCASNTQTPPANAVCGLNGNCGVSSENQDGDYIRIPLSEISSSIKKYSYNVDGAKVNYFAVKGSDGQVRTAFDACDICGGYKGYFQKGNKVVCNKCGNSFRIDDLGTKNTPGGCWPSFLSNSIEGNDILIKKSELEKGAFRFS